VGVGVVGWWGKDNHCSITILLNLPIHIVQFIVILSLEVSCSAGPNAFKTVLQYLYLKKMWGFYKIAALGGLLH
jgi:hypothetical protein